MNEREQIIRGTMTGTGEVTDSSGRIHSVPQNENADGSIPVGERVVIRDGNVRQVFGS